MKIFLSAYLNNNLGDDLMIEIICDRYRQHEFYISNNNNLQSFACKRENLHIINSITPTNDQTILKIINKLISYLNIPKLQIMTFLKKNQFDLYLELGGSIFMQITPKSWVNKVRDSAYIVAHCPRNAIIGCNFGPYFTKDFPLKHKKLFSKYDFISFREQVSYELFKELKNTYCYPDLVFNRSVYPVVGSEYIGISVIGLRKLGSTDSQDSYLSGMVDLISNLRSKHKICLLSFCTNEGDLITCKKIIEKGNFNLEEVEIYEHKNIEGTLKILCNLSAMIATRFHANILALAMNIPLLPVIYSDKTKHMLDDLKFRGYTWNLLEHNKLDLQASLKQIVHLPIYEKDKLQAAKGHFSYLDQVLNYDES